jgi:hypothetical protein
MYSNAMSGQVSMFHQQVSGYMRRTKLMLLKERHIKIKSIFMTDLNSTSNFSVRHDDGVLLDENKKKKVWKLYGDKIKVDFNMVPTSFIIVVIEYKHSTNLGAM